MRVKLDENIPVSDAVVAQRLGHDADTVTSEGLVGSADPEVLAAALVTAACLSRSTEASATFAPIRPEAMAGSSCCGLSRRTQPV